MCAQKFSLSFSKTIEKKSLQPSVIRNDAPAEVKEKTEVIESIEENVLKTDGQTEETELVIPMVQIDRAAVFRKLAEKREESKEKDEVIEDTSSREAEDNIQDYKPLTLDEQAEAAILEDSKRLLESWDVRGKKDDITISLASEEKSPDTEVVDGKESSLDDYNEVDVSVFGKAVLRGMGWKKSEGIGGKSKRVVEIIDPSSKSFGLAGKNRETRSGTSDGKDGSQEELILVKGAYVYIHSGRHRGTYGVVESLDEDHLLVKAALSQNMIREVELNVRVVTVKEFKDSSRVINKDMYDKYKEKEVRKKDVYEKKANDSDLSLDNSSDEKKKAVEKGLKIDKVKKEKIVYDSSGKEASKNDHQSAVISKMNQKEHKLTEKIDKHKKEMKCREHEGRSEKNIVHKEEVSKGEDSSNRHIEKYKSKFSEQYLDNERCTEYAKNGKAKEDLAKQRYSNNSQNSNSKSRSKREYEESYSQGPKKVFRKQDKMPAIPWVRENLRVRLISKCYKGGRYYKEKVIVQNVETAESCECITEEGKVLREVHPEWLETVIPKVHPQIVMIVKGQQKSQKGRILQLHKEQEKASVQLLEDETVILKLHYDDICEYVRR